MGVRVGVYVWDSCLVLGFSVTWFRKVVVEVHRCVCLYVCAKKDPVQQFNKPIAKITTHTHTHAHARAHTYIHTQSMIGSKKG